MRCRVAFLGIAASLAFAASAHGATSLSLVWSNEVLLGYTEGPGSMIITDGTLIAQTTASATGPQTVSGFDPVTGRSYFQVPDGSSLGGIRSGLGEGHGTGLFFQINGASFPNMPTLNARETGQGSVIWSFNGYFDNTNGQPKPYALDMHVYSGTEVMHVVDAIAGGQVATAGDASNLAGSHISSFVAADGSPVILFPWLGQLTAYNVSNASSPTVAWTFSKELPGDETVTARPFVTPDQKTVFVQSEGANSTSEGLWIAAVSTVTGTLESAGFNLLHVPWGTEVFAVTNSVVLCTETATNANVVAYSRDTGAVVWNYTVVAALFLSHSCVLEPKNGTLVCVATTTTTTPQSKIVKLNPNTGAVLWSYVIPQSQGVIQTSGGFAPLIVGNDEVIVLWSDPQNATQPNPPLYLRRLRLVDHAAPTPAPPTLPPSSTITVLEFPDPSCTAGTGTTRTFKDGGCTAEGTAASTLRFCVGSTLHVQSFSGTSTCTGTPAATATFAVGQCYTQPLEGTALEVTHCA
eukprot:CAMPEP_0174835414 /NCGR_PEP_ID=MMETSP1114-20130205/5394_1 /TAXON_ID=312471 /ORGANISM="Neobodo designis, Strain CCAP 1951/1" /LENGTH=520 /DNA_ID=CAMNT_0016069361 /DNA_START=50 /DNA_END=1612 /DNA_ORIENTATION=+